MRKILFAVLVGLLSTLSIKNVHAQAWEKDTKVISINIGGASYFHPNKNFTNSSLSTVTGQLLVQGEFGVHEYVGVGFSAGFGGGAGVRPFGRWAYYGYYGQYYRNGISEINIPIGALANFHFYQLIADKTGADIHSDKLDIYAGVSIGSGVAFMNPGRSGDFIAPLAYGGPHVGIRYYFTDKIAVNGEFGYGKTFANAGIVFKL